MKIIVLGIGGLIGSTVFRVLSSEKNLNVFGTCRSANTLEFFKNITHEKINYSLNVNMIASVRDYLIAIRPDVVINCVGITKHLSNSNDPSVVIPVNTLFPHLLSDICSENEIRLIHVSSDCVFLGNKGNYSEEENPDANDLYGRSKALGEPVGINDLTLRISTIGHELNTNYGLLNWFLMQENTCRGYVNAIFSGIPTVFFSEVLRDYVLPNNKLKGLYHVAADPIDKYSLLNLIAIEYKKNISIIPDDSIKINRSLSFTKFHEMTGYTPPPWDILIKIMANNKFIQNV